MQHQRLKIEFPSQGWKQILTARKAMLDSYDRAREQTRIHEAETFHGNVAEAETRKWLSDFLPKRYGVTSGYIVSPGLKSNVRTPHFDVIIYDRLDSPVLWVENSSDLSEQGRSLAIPVEYVQAVLEVKAAFSSRTVKESIEHLKDLSPLMAGVDDPHERYKLHLPPNFACGVLFFELRKEDQHSYAALSGMIEGVELRGFFGGVLLRCEGHTDQHTGRIELLNSETAIESGMKDRNTPLGELGLSPSRLINEQFHIAAILKWSESQFAQFAFDLIAMMQGTYEAGRLSSFYGAGNSFFEMMRDVGAKIITPDDKGTA